MFNIRNDTKKRINLCSFVLNFIGNSWIFLHCISFLIRNSMKICFGVNKLSRCLLDLFMSHFEFVDWEGYREFVEEFLENFVVEAFLEPFAWFYGVFGSPFLSLIIPFNFFIAGPTLFITTEIIILFLPISKTTLQHRFLFSFISTMDILYKISNHRLATNQIPENNLKWK